MKDCNFQKYLFTFLGGAAVGVALGILYAPDKGSATRKKIVRKTKEFSHDVTEKFEDLKIRAEELIDDIKQAALDFTSPLEVEIEEDEETA